MILFEVKVYFEDCFVGVGFWFLRIMILLVIVDLLNCDLCDVVDG